MPQILTQSFSTTSVEDAQRSMAALYGPMYLAADPPQNFSYETSAVSDSVLTVARLRYVGTCRSGTAAFPDFVLAHAVAGQHRWAIGRESGSGAVPFLVPPQHPLDVYFEDLDMITVSVDPEAVEAVVRALTGSERVRLITDRLNSRRRNPRYLAATMGYLERALRDPATFANPMIRAEATRQAVVAMVSTFPLVDPEAGRDEDDRSLSRNLRHAMTFIEDNADKAITVNDVADAVHLSVRGLQVAFQRRIGTTPTEYLRKVRLAAARVELLRGDPEVHRVDEIARRWGFAHPAYFAARYREAHGEAPSQTLRRR